MRKFIYISGIACINVFLIGAVMKISHWPGANIMIMLGLGLTSLLFLPPATYTAYKDGNIQSQKWIYICGFLCAFIDLIGAMFKIVHLPGANWLLLIGIPVPFILFLPVFVYHHIKQKELQMKGFLGVMFLMTYIAIFTALLAVKP
jgi:hypothetical protein